MVSQMRYFALFLLFFAPVASADIYWSQVDDCALTAEPSSYNVNLMNNKNTQCLAAGNQCSTKIEDKGYNQTQNCPYYLKSYFVFYVPGSCPNGSTYDADTGTCVEADKTADQCRETGQKLEGTQCVDECSSGSELDSVCLNPPDQTCSSEDSDYIGLIGFGGNQKLVCGDNKCADGGRFGFSSDPSGNYVAQCFPPDANSPQCPTGSALIVGSGGYSFQCENITLKDSDGDGVPDGKTDSNGDSDGDGQGDTTGITNQISDIKELLRTGNNNTGNLKGKLDELNKTMGDGLQGVKDAIGNIPGGGGSTGDGETPDPVTWAGESILMEVDDGLEELQAVKGEYETMISNIRAEMAGSFGSITGSGTLPSNTITIEGVQIEAGLAKWAEQLSIVGMVILFAAAFVSLGIVMGAKD